MKPNHQIKMPSNFLAIQYAVQTSDDQGLRVVYTQNTTHNHDSYNIYANQY